MRGRPVARRPTQRERTKPPTANATDGGRLSRALTDVIATGRELDVDTLEVLLYGRPLRDDAQRELANQLEQEHTDHLFDAVADERHTIAEQTMTYSSRPR